ncbi:MAG: hypothetical protein HDQ88_11105 [Clostridia bacterium]|nr:hypothetical protein [Clostridia bacterium]
MEPKLGQKVFCEAPWEQVTEGTVMGFGNGMISVNTDRCRFDIEPDNCFESYDDALAGQWLRRQRDVDAKLGGINDAETLLRYALSEIQGYVPKKVLMLKAKELLGIDLMETKTEKPTTGKYRKWDLVFCPDGWDEIVQARIVAIGTMDRLTVTTGNTEFDVDEKGCFDTYEKAYDHANKKKG